MTSVNFCKIAHLFNFLEMFAFGLSMTKSRSFIFCSKGKFRNVLMIGEGTGRFAKDFQHYYPHSKIVILEPSEKMRLEISKSLETDSKNVKVLETRLENFKPSMQFDLICTCFFWDCFNTKQIDEFEVNFKHLCNSTRLWYNVDFYEPRIVGNLRSLSNITIIRFLYVFFQKFAHLDTCKLNSITHLFCQNGFSLVKQRVLLFPSIKSQLFKRTSS